jgi:aldose 1-epimerase
MSFSIRRFTEDGLSFVSLQDKATNTIITILPEYGASLHGFEIPVQGQMLNIIDNYANRQDIREYLEVFYKSSKLSPFVCRMRNGKYTIDDEAFEITKKTNNGHAIHGLLYNKPFKVMDEFADDKNANITLRYHFKKDDPGYPFEYVCDVRYTLLPQQTLQIETILLNTDTESIPLADGWHPYFQLGGTIDDYDLQFCSDTMVEFDDQLIPTGQTVPEDTFAHGVRIGKTELDNCFVLQPVDQKPVCVLHNPNNRAWLAIFTNTRYPYLQVYTPKHRKSIAIENLSGAPDCFNNGMGLLLLPPSRSQTFTVYYQAGVAENE